MKTIIHVILCIAFCLPVLAAGAGSPVHIIKFENINGFIVLEAECNGLPGTYIFDTGAPGLILNASHSYTGPVETVNLLGSQGSFMAEKLHGNTFILGDVKFRGENAYLLPLDFIEHSIGRSVEGLFGLSLLKRYEIVIDMRATEIRFSKHRGRLDLGKDGIYVDLIYQQHLPTVAFNIGEQIFRFGLDTGSKSNLICRDEAGNIPEFRKTFEEHVALSSADQRISIVPLVAIDIQESRTDVMASSHYLHFLLTDMASVSHDADITIDGILGQDFIAGKVIHIDKFRNKIGITGDQVECNSLALR